MADAVERALADDRILLCEAGTGTGKTLAYLVPAISSGRKVVVSTATRALQEQIATRDLPLIRRHLGLEPDAVVMKGLGNYLCLRRFEELRRGGAALDPMRDRALAALERWREATTTGDVGELGELAENDPIWREVTSSSETRVGPDCAYFDQCFVTRMKRAAESARLLVVNHHLFFADLALRGPHPGHVIPDYDAVIFDEAHQLEDIATDFFGVRVSSARIETTLRDLERVLAVLARSGPVPGDAAITAARRAADAFWARLGRALDTEGRTTVERELWSGELAARWHDLDSALEGVVALAVAARGRLSGGAESGSVADALDVAGRRAGEIRTDLAVAIDGAPGRITWFERAAKSAVLSSSPVDVSRLFRELVFERISAVVLTSATLATGGGDVAGAMLEESPFAYLRQRLGLVADGPEVTEHLIPSPFDFPENALLYTPRDLPEPSDPTFIRRAAERALELIELTDGGAFVLTTSLRSMRLIHQALSPALGERPLMLQGEAPKSALLERFRRAEDAVLVATQSFWEGVDIPGRALRLVVLEKIPFLVPSDPIVKARSEQIEADGGNAFMALHVPAAAIALKQGFGRLIRTHTDRGIVALFDARVHKRGYGRRVLASLPPARRENELEAVRRFWKKSQ
jgi:ATP-dependent DNA helicase DinG